jgi:uncharacterized membrane protein YvbJ
MSNIKCVHCGKVVFEWAPQCPHCGKPIANPDAPTSVSAEPKTWKKTSYKKKSPIPLIVAIAAAVIIAAAAYYLLMHFKG